MHNGKYQRRMASYTHHLIIMGISKTPTLCLKAPTIIMAQSAYHNYGSKRLPYGSKCLSLLWLKAPTAWLKNAYRNYGSKRLP